jgi:hypothetical protein
MATLYLTLDITGFPTPPEMARNEHDPSVARGAGRPVSVERLLYVCRVVPGGAMNLGRADATAVHWPQISVLCPVGRSSAGPHMIFVAELKTYVHFTAGLWLIILLEWANMRKL